MIKLIKLNKMQQKTHQEKDTPGTRRKYSKYVYELMLRIHRVYDLPFVVQKGKTSRWNRIWVDDTWMINPPKCGKNNVVCSDKVLYKVVCC